MEVTINYNGQAVAVEVTLEVYEFLDRADYKAENLSLFSRGASCKYAGTHFIIKNYGQQLSNDCCLSFC